MPARGQIQTTETNHRIKPLSTTLFTTLSTKWAPPAAAQDADAHSAPANSILVALIASSSYEAEAPSTLRVAIAAPLAEICSYQSSRYAMSQNISGN